MITGYWFSPEREFVQSCLEKSQETVNGRVRLALVMGNVIVEGRKSDTEALYDAEQVSMDSVTNFDPSATTYVSLSLSSLSPDYRVRCTDKFRDWVCTVVSSLSNLSVSG